MTTEEKARAYDEALKRAKKERAACGSMDCDAARQIFRLFPQLRESEDERIIEEIKFAVMQMPSSRQDTKNRCLAYLEKQKEQKPKFYPGDVIKCTSTGSLWVRCKDGDNIRSDGHTACIGGGYELASKEEAVQFFQELNENGYQWDCIKGRPMKKEQKPAEWNKATVNGGPIPTENQSIDIPLAEWSDEDADMLNCCISSIEEAKENRYAYKETDGDTSYDREIDWLKSLRPSWKPSEQEKGALRTAIYVLREERNFPKAAGHLQAILDAFEGKESRKDWKPSKGQMDALRASNSYWKGTTNEVPRTDLLESLYNDLEKLIAKR